MTFWAYMLHCRGGVFYTGHTDDLQRRVAEHQSGALPGFTQRHLPLELVWSQEFPSRYEALAAERQIKAWSRAKKLALIRGDWVKIAGLAKNKGSPSTSSGRTGLVVAKKVLDGLCGETVRALPNECCGILLGLGTIDAALPAFNVAADPAREFEIDPAVLIAAHRSARQGGPQVLGYYHSHPNGLAAPSATDQRMAAHDNRIWAIVAAGEVTFWRDTPGGFEALSYAVADG